MLEQLEVSFDSIETNILTTWMVEDGTLNIVTDLNPMLRIGSYIQYETDLKTRLQTEHVV